jgi:hypothetical protein
MPASLKNPIPLVREAAESAAKIALLERDLSVLSAELLAARQAKRLILAVAGAVFLTIALTLGLFWFTWMIRETGVGPGWIALGSVIVFGGVSALLFVSAAKT